MPTVNIFHQSKEQATQLDALIRELKGLVAKELSCSDISLTPEEVSIRLVANQGDGMIAPVEIEVTAHAFAERIEKQDEICLHLREFVTEKLNGLDVRVWLLLPQLGHSWEDKS